MLDFLILIFVEFFYFFLVGICGPKSKWRIIRRPKLNKYGQRACSTDLTSFLLGFEPSFLMSTNTLETSTSSTLSPERSKGKMVEDFSSSSISNRNLKLKSPLKTIDGRDHKWQKNAKNFLQSTKAETTQRILLKLDFTLSHHTVRKSEIVSKNSIFRKTQNSEFEFLS